MTNFDSVLFNTEVKALKYDGHHFTFRNCMLDSIIQHNEALKDLVVEANMINTVFL